ncbi:hypothetical protein AgCh_033660 [Apium graveolens]
MARPQLLCLEAVEPVVDELGVKRGIAFVELPLDPLRGMEGDGAGPIGAGVEPIVIVLVDCNMAGAWPEQKTTNMNKNISMNITRERDMILS